ncbi:trans-Golgi network integral membrane protein TGN38-like [Dendronephthya gigantea]|uniref:trans-Golgi network integral membrane protein TGN38-like n=1 Tax=Dendronephthya gigantea TaxID=151771 RepID=UPI00106A6F11|nr:trans-Golgi network integral membrane protein TGN38-like [Dendronephthya gigantea]
MSAKEFEKRLKAFDNKTFSRYWEVFKKVLKQKGQQLEKSSPPTKVTTTKKGSKKSPTQSEKSSPSKKVTTAKEGPKKSPTQSGKDSVTTKTDTTTTKAGDNMKNSIGSNGGNDHAKSGPKFPSKTPESSHFAVVFLVLIALLFGLYALYHNRQKIIAVVVEGRSGHGRSARERYRKLDNSPEDNEVRIKNSNEVYVY